MANEYAFMILGRSFVFYFGAILKFHNMGLIEYFKFLYLAKWIPIILVNELKKAKILGYIHICEKAIKELLIGLKIAVSHFYHEDSNCQLNSHLELFPNNFFTLAA
jgi:hypothetical protein